MKACKGLRSHRGQASFADVGVAFGGRRSMDEVTVSKVQPIKAVYNMRNEGPQSGPSLAQYHLSLVPFSPASVEPVPIS